MKGQCFTFSSFRSGFSRVEILGFHPSVILQVNLMLIGMGVGRGAGAVP